MNQRPAFETNGTLELVIGGVLLFVAVMALTAEVHGLITLGLAAIGIVLLVRGIKKALRPREHSTAGQPSTPSDTA